MTFATLPSSRDMALGVLGTSIALPLGYSAMKGAGYFMTQWDLPIEESFTVFRFYDALEKVSDSVLRSALKVLAILYVVIITPIIEEWVFRGLIYKWQSSDAGQVESSAYKTYRILSNALICGAFHIHPLQGWVNIPIFAVSTISGIVFATLREITQNQWASTIAHSLNNTFVLFITFLKI